MAIDLEVKTQSALATRLKQNPGLTGVRFRHNSEDSAKVNGDMVIVAKRGDGNPPYSGIYNLEVSIMFTMGYRKTVNTLPEFLNLCASIEQVLNVKTYVLAAQLSKCVEAFHCYEIAVTGKDSTPQDDRHSCIWNLSCIAASQSYDSSVKLQTPN